MAQSSLPINLSIDYQKQFLSLLSKKDLETLTQKHSADHLVSQLHASKIFKLYLLAFLDPKEPSLRGIAQYSHQLATRFLTGLSPVQAAALSKRNQKLSYLFFQDIFELLRSRVKPKILANNPLLQSAEKLQVFDSTFIELSMKLFPWTVNKKQSNKGVFKLGLRLQDQGDIPEKVIIQTDSTNDNPLFEPLMDLSKQGTTYLFDRGFQTIESLYKIVETNNFFITRVFPSYKITTLCSLESGLRTQNQAFWFVKEELVLIGAGQRQMPHPLRLVTVRTRKGNKTYRFLTNREDLTAEDVAKLYLKRWQIEPFFKWLKQALKINRFISRSKNGVMIQIYVVLILQLLFALFKKRSKMNYSYRLQYLREMQNQFMDNLIWLAFSFGQKLAKQDCFFHKQTDLQHYVKKQLVTRLH